MATTYRVVGMSCQGCAKGVTSAIQAVKAEARVDVDLDAKTVTVDGLDDDEAVARAVADAGFEYEGRVS